MREHYELTNITPDKVLDVDHIFAKFVSDPDGTRQLAIDDPVTFASEVLSSFGGSLFSHSRN